MTMSPNENDVFNRSSSYIWRDLERRQRLIARFSQIALVVVAPFVVLTLMEGDLFQGIADILVVLALAITAWHYQRGRELPWQGAETLVLACLAVVSALVTHGVYMLYWAFAMIPALHALLPLKRAAFINILFIAILCAILPMYLPWNELTRAVAALAMASGFSWIFSSTVAEQHKRLSELAMFDPLTGCYNRRLLEDALDNLFNIFERYRTPFSVVVFDLDHFKQVNDSFGHQEGDRILIRLTQLVKQRLRRADKVFRYGGEEFLIVMPHTAMDDGFRVSDQLRELVAERISIGDRPVTISCGVSQARAGDTPGALVRRADIGLYKSKANGRNRTTAIDLEDPTGDVLVSSEMPTDPVSQDH